MTSAAPSDPGLGTGFRVWAPAAAQSVELVLRPGSADEDRLPLERRQRGWWQGLRSLAPGERYGISIDGAPAIGDPRAVCLPEGPHWAAEHADVTDFAWTDQQWRGVRLEGSVIYELHIGTFSPQGTFDGAIAQLDHLVDLGVDIVEVMPVASFPGRHGWGYDGVALWAVHEPYGGMRGLQRFVDACHARGLGVFLDLVYNHLGPDGNYVNTFGPYFHDEYETPWGWAANFDGEHSDEVRAYVLDNLRYWLRDYHLDGARLDAVHELHDERALHILEEMSQVIAALADQVGRPLSLIAESDRNDPRTVTPVERGGLGLHGQWADDVHHALHVTLTGETQGYYADFDGTRATGEATNTAVLARMLTTPFFHDGGYSSFRGRSHGRPVDPERIPGSAFVAALQTHDQVGNRATGDRLSATLSVNRLCLGAALLLTSPYTPMLFMGEEYAASTPWQYFTDHVDTELAVAVSHGRRIEFAAHGWSEDEVPDPQHPDTLDASRLRLSEAGEGEHAVVLGWYRRLLQLRRERSDLRDADLAAVVVEHDPQTGRMLIHRGAHRVAVNIGPEPVTIETGLDATVATVVASPQDDVRLAADGTITLPTDGVAILGPQDV